MRKFALIGCGDIANRYAENMARVGTLVAVCDVVKEKRDAFAATYNAIAYANIDSLLQAENEVEIVVVCTPNGLHAEHIIKSLQASKHVLCETPLCLTTAAAWQIMETEKFCRRKLFVVKSTRYNPLLKVLKKTISANQLGRIYSFHLSCIWNRPESYYTDWKGKLFPAGGTLYTPFSHCIDTLLWLFGDVTEVKGFRSNAAHSHSIEFEDTGVAALQMHGGTLGSLHWSVNAYRKNHEIALTIVAENGTVRVGGENLNEIHYTETKTALPLIPFENGDSEYNLYREVYNHLLQVLDINDHSFTGGYDGLKTVETIEKIYKAIL